MKIDIDIPDEIADHASELRFFFDTMVKKLHLNRHKGFADGAHPVTLMDLCAKELEEQRDALLHKDQFSAYVEAVDVANMAFLSGVCTLRMTRIEYEKDRK